MQRVREKIRAALPAPAPANRVFIGRAVQLSAEQLSCLASLVVPRVMCCGAAVGTRAGRVAAKAALRPRAEWFARPAAHDHTVDFHYYLPELNIVVCQTGIYSVAGSALLLGFGTPPTPVMLVFDQPDADTLHLMNDGGDELVLARAAEIPEQFQCLPLTPVHTYTGLPRPHERTGMAYDRSRLWYTTDASVLQAIDPEDGTPGDTRVLTTPLVHAYQGGAFWVISGSGAMEQAQHRKLDDTLLDQIDTRVDLGEANRIEVLAWESRDNVLWVHGSLPDHSADRFLRVACLGEPDELLGIDEFDVAISAMSWHGRELWAIVSGMVVQLDMTALRGEVTYRVDLPGIRWRGIAWAGDAMFLIGANDDGGVLVEVDPG